MKCTDNRKSRYSIGHVICFSKHLTAQPKKAVKRVVNDNSNLPYLKQVKILRAGGTTQNHICTEDKVWHVLQIRNSEVSFFIKFYPFYIHTASQNKETAQHNSKQAKVYQQICNWSNHSTRHNVSTSSCISIVLLPKSPRLSARRKLIAGSQDHQLGST